MNSKPTKLTAPKFSCGHSGGAARGKRLTEFFARPCLQCRLASEAEFEATLTTPTNALLAAAPATGIRMAAVAKSWSDPATNAARSARHKIKVVTPDGTERLFDSRRKAFAELGLPDSKHITFRGDLVKAGKGSISGFTFFVATAA